MAGLDLFEILEKEGIGEFAEALLASGLVDARDTFEVQYRDARRVYIAPLPSSVQKEITDAAVKAAFRDTGAERKYRGGSGGKPPEPDRLELYSISHRIMTKRLQAWRL